MLLLGTVYNTEMFIVVTICRQIDLQLKTTQGMYVVELSKRCCVVVAFDLIKNRSYLLHFVAVSMLTLTLS